ncbi:MAG: ABC transporter ATP-binding protein/permease [Candidatus Saccharibacteria bacterium]|nr:ABC transporter ATP-binding protein/permease [Candidatus Saccharibacteria bacterium]
MKQSLFRKIYGILDKKQKISFLLVLLLLGLSAILSQITPLTIGYLTDQVLARDEIVFTAVIPILLVILVVTVSNEIIKVIRRLMVEGVATKVELRARTKASSSLMTAPLSYFRKHMTGNIHGRLNRSIEGVSKLVKLVFMDFAPAIATGVAAIVVIFTQLPPLVALLVIAVIPVGLIIVWRQIETQRGIRVDLMEQKAEMDGTMVELLGGIETIRSLNSVDMEVSRVENKSSMLRSREMKHHKSMAFYDCAKFINEAVFTVLVIAISVVLASNGIIAVGSILTIYLCFTQLTAPLRELHRILDELSECKVLADDYFKIAELPKDFSYQTSDKYYDEIINNDVLLKHVSMGYDEEPDKKILNNIDLEINKGEFIGIVGPSGCGKSTLIKIIDKLEQASGEIRIGGIDLSKLSRAEIAKSIALVPQTPFLVAGTIAENIAYGLEENISPEAIAEAAKSANLEETINNLPKKYNFMISEGGRNLSGGQRQRIALARIFLRKPKILILDEATSALDNTSEKHVQKEIEKLKEEYNTTIISIAHRLTTLQNCDEIIVIDKGKIVQRGTFSELSDTPGIFQDMKNGILK